MKTNLKRACLSAAVIGVFTAALAGTALAQAADPQIGTWKLNVAKSTFNPGPAPKSGNTKIEAAGAGAKLIVDQTTADGTARHWEFTANYDGKDVPIVGNNPDADTVARTRVNANTVQTISKKAGNSRHHAAVHGVGRRQDAHRDDQGRERRREDRRQRRGLRAAVSDKRRPAPALRGGRTTLRARRATLAHRLYLRMRSWKPADAFSGAHAGSCWSA